MPLDTAAAHILSRLVLELSTELDLHHEDDDMLTLHDTIDALTDAAELLRENGQPLPDPYLHILDRYIRSGAPALHLSSKDKH